MARPNGEHYRAEMDEPICAELGRNSGDANEDGWLCLKANRDRRTERWMALTGFHGDRKVVKKGGFAV